MKNFLSSSEEAFSTEGDSNWSFIDRLPVKAAYFDGGLKRYDADTTSFCHLGDDYTPFYSLHTGNDPGQVIDVLLFAVRKDGLPGLTVFIRKEPRLQLSALYVNLISLMYARQIKSRCGLRLERSHACVNGSPPSSRFVRDMFQLAPLAGLKYYAIFPGRDKLAAMVVRLVTYVTSFTSGPGFVPFQSQDEFDSWVQTQKTQMAVSDLTELDLFSEQRAEMKYFWQLFETLRDRWHEDAEALEGLLGDARRPAIKKTPSVAVRETHLDYKTGVDVANSDVEVAESLGSAEVSVESLANSAKGLRNKGNVRRMALESITEEGD